MVSKKKKKKKILGQLSHYSSRSNARVYNWIVTFVIFGKEFFDKKTRNFIQRRIKTLHQTLKSVSIILRDPSIQVTKSEMLLAY